MQLEIGGKVPVIDKSAFVAPNATIIGDVTIASDVGIWFGAVIRGDLNSIKIGSYTNVQDLCVIHTPPHICAEIGEYVTVGHRALVHGCKIGNNCLIGMSSTIMNGAEIGDNSIVAAGSLVTENKKMPAGSLIMGSPAKVVRELTPEEVRKITKSAIDYYEYSRRYI